MGEGLARDSQQIKEVPKLDFKTPATRGAEKMRENHFFSRKKKVIFLDIPSSYAKILGETNFQSRKFP